jgi:hypothetical protein
MTSIKPNHAILRGIGARTPDKKYEARLASDASTMRDAYQLRYSSYLSQGHIQSNAEQLFKDKYDDLPTARTIVVYEQGRAVGSVRTCLLRPGDMTISPVRDSYRHEVDALLNACRPQTRGYQGVEVNRLVRAPESADDQGLVFMLLRLAGQVGLSVDFQMVFSCIRLHHLPLYRRLRFSEAGDVKLYPGLTCPMVLMKLPRAEWEATRSGFQLLDPGAESGGVLDGLEYGNTVYPRLVRRG